MTLINYEERLKTVLYKKGILITNRKDKYDQVIKRLTAAVILKGIEKNPRLSKVFIRKFEKTFGLMRMS